MTTRARILSWNLRRKTYKPDWLIPSRRWPNRLPYAVKFLKDVAPSVIAVQECAGSQSADLVRGLGPNWTFWGEPSNRQVIWNGDKWDAIDARAQVIASKTEQEATHVQLKSRETGAVLWVSSVHLTQGSTNGKWRNLEMREILKYQKKLPGHEVSVICGDLNSETETSGPRLIAAEAGYKSLRAKTTNDEIKGESYSSFNGWKKTPATGRWIDDVLSPKAVEPYGGGVQLCCLRVFDVCASDHDGMLARVAF